MELSSPPNIEKMEAKHDIKGLVKALGYQKDVDIREAAAFALERIGDVRAVEPLIATLKDTYTSVRHAAVDALVKIGAPAVKPLIAALRDSDKNVRYLAVNALCKLGDARAVEPLTAALKDSDKDVRYAAVDALGKIGAPGCGAAHRRAQG